MGFEPKREEVRRMINWRLSDEPVRGAAARLLRASSPVATCARRHHWRGRAARQPRRSAGVAARPASPLRRPGSQVKADEDDELRSESARAAVRCTIFLGVTSNLISAGA